MNDSRSTATHDEALFRKIEEQGQNLAVLAAYVNDAESWAGAFKGLLKFALLAVKNQRSTPPSAVQRVETVVDQVLADNPAHVQEYRAGNEKAFNWLVGQVMTASGGKANPATVNELLRARLAPSSIAASEANALADEIERDGLCSLCDYAQNYMGHGERKVIPFPPDSNRELIVKALRSFSPQSATKEIK